MRWKNHLNHSKKTKSLKEDPWHNFRLILIILSPVFLIGIFLIWLSVQIESDRLSHIVAEFGIVLAAFSVVDVILHTFLEAIAARPTAEEAAMTASIDAYRKLAGG